MEYKLNLEGRELDAAVHREIFNKSCHSLDREILLPYYSSDIAAAMRVVEKMKERKPRLMINLAMFWGHTVWVYKAEFIEETSPKYWESFCDNWPKAICRAALMAAEAE
jgi:hypothetical protein